MAKHLPTLIPYMGLSLLIPQVALATGMGGLAYVVILWPIGLLLFVALLALHIVGRLKHKRQGKGAAPNLGRALALSALVLPPLFTLLTFWVDRQFRAGGDAIAITISLFPVYLVCLLNFLLSAKLKRKAP